MNWLRDKLELLYEKEGSQYLKDPWKARNDYIEVILDESRKSREKFLGTHTHEILSTEEKVRVLKLMEMQRNAMLMFTSCGWFFDEISGIETVQVLHYAARAVQLIQEVSETAVEHDYLSILEGAQSNLPGFSNGKRIYELFVKPAILDLTRVGAHYAISSLFEEYPTHTHIYCYTVNVDVYDITEAGKLRLALGKAQIASGMTWDTKTISFAVLHLGDHNFNGGIIDYIDNRIFASMSQEIKEAFGRGDVPEVIRLMDKHFGVNIYSLWHLFRDEQRKILDQVLQSTLDEIRVSFRQLYEGNYIIMNFMYEVCYPLPKPLLAATEFVLNADIKEIIEAEQLNFERLKYLIAELKRWGVSLEKPMLSFISNVKINSLMENLSENFEDLVLMEEIEKTLSLLRLLPLDLDLWKSQNIYCNIEQAHYNTKKEMAEKGREDAKKWLEIFHNLGHHLKIKVS